MRILFVGDVVGPIGVQMIETYLPQLKRDLKPQVTIVNGENSTNVGRGISHDIYKQFQRAGADVVTLGNHAWDNAELLTFIDSEDRLIRPANFPGPDVPGRGLTHLRINQAKLAVVNMQGRVFLPPLDDPFAKMDDLLANDIDDDELVFVDFHAEVTSEKKAFALNYQDRVTAVVGTHTHVQTNDASILGHHVGFLTDAGMTGPVDSILGMKAGGVLTRFKTQRPTRYEVQTTGPGMLCGAIIDVNEKTQATTSIKPIVISPDHPYQG